MALQSIGKLKNSLPTAIPGGMRSQIMAKRPMGGTMNGYELKQKVQSGGIVYGTMISVSRNPRWTSPMSDFGLDYVIIDSEHSPRGRSEMADFIAAFSFSGVAPIVRIPIPDSHYVTMALDAGAHGILAPYCETVEEVKEVVGAAKWRPLKGSMVRRVIDKGEFPSQATKEYLEARNPASSASRACPQ